MKKQCKALYRTGTVLLALVTALGCVSCGSGKPTDINTASQSEETTLPADPEESEPKADQYMTVDFSKRDGAPLVKKFGMFDSGLVGITRTAKDLDKIDGLRAESLRVELGMGRGDMIFDDLITGDIGDMKYKWDDIDRFTELLNSKNVRPYLSYGYCPYPMQGTSKDCRSQPSDLDALSEALEMIAVHFRENGISVGYHEIWNEPDCGDMFYTGSWEDYCKLYEYGVKGIRAGNPDAVVGGPSTAWIFDPDSRYREFLSYVKKNDLPLDFFSMHHYGTTVELEKKLATLRGNISSQGDRFLTTSIHINELNTIASPAWNYGGPCDSYEMGAEVFRMIEFLVDQNDVEVVSWAQFLESGVDALGVVNAQGHKKAAYNAFAIYGRMPADRCEVKEKSRGVSGMASSDGHRASLVVWNNIKREQSLDLELSSLPFDSGTVTVYRIDRRYSGYGTSKGENLTPAETIEYSGGSFDWSGNIAKNGVVYIEINDGSAADNIAPSAPGDAVVIRREHYYSSRGTSNYAYFDEHTWTARLGSGSEGDSDSVVGVVAEGLPDILKVSFDIEGEPAANGKNSLLGMRVEFETLSGYKNAVLFHGGIYDGTRDDALPWGSGEPAGNAVEVELSSFEIRLSDYAPDDWNGRVLIVFEMNDCGEGVSAVISVK